MFVNIHFGRLLLAAIVHLTGTPLLACPFCTALRPTLAQQRDGADAAILGELASVEGPTWTVRVHRSLKESDRFPPKTLIETLPTDEGGLAIRPGTLVLMLGSRQPGEDAHEYSWTAIRMNEASYAYVARLPSRKTSVAERLFYFVDYLEHADPLIAEDAYLEFGHAPFDEVAGIADRLPIDRLREWLIDDTTPPERKGLYGLLLGLAADAQERPEVIADFRRMITAPASDFRSGFDGVLGGYLWLEKETGLARLESRYLDNAQAATGDLRHFMTALRVYHDNGGAIPRDDLLRVYRRLLQRPALAATVATDLRRWQDWQALDQVASLFGRPAYDDPTIERAVIAYLLACPLPVAERQVARLRKLIPTRVAEAELEAGESGGK